MESQSFELFHQSAEQAARQPLSVLSTQLPTSPQTASNEVHSRTNPQDTSGTVRSQMFREVAQITAQGFQSSQEAMSTALDVLAHFLNCEGLFIGQIRENSSDKIASLADQESSQRVLRIVETRNKAASCLCSGTEVALNKTYCQTIWRTRQPLIVENSQQNAFYRQLASTREYNIGSYIGVPLLYSDGQIYGTLCAHDSQPLPLTSQPEKLELMQIVARFLISYIEHEELMAQLHAAEQAQAQLMHKEQEARAEADLRVRELEAVFEAMGDGLFVCDLSGQIQMNAAARSLLLMPFPQANLQGLIHQQEQDTLVWDEHGLPLATEDWPIQRVLQGEQLTGAEVVNIQRVNALGEKRYLNVSGMPIYDQWHKIHGAVLAFRDVTERYLLEQRTHETLHALLALAESLAWLPENEQQYFPAVANHSPSSQFAHQHLIQLISTLLQCQDVGLISIDPETEKWHLLSAWRPSPVSEFPWWEQARQILASSQTDDLPHLRSNEVVLHALLERVDVAPPVLMEAPMFLGNHLLGVLVLLYDHHETALTPLEDALTRAVAKLTGLIYERERLLQEQAEARAHTLALQETNGRFNEFLSIASHELKGPLTTIQGNIQFAQRTLSTLLAQGAQAAEAPELQKLQRYLERAARQVHVQDRLASDLIDVARIRAGKLELYRRPCDIGQVVCEVVEDQRQVAEGRMITLELLRGPLLIYGDADRLGQVVRNYLTNALKYSASTQPVAVGITVSAGSVQVAVSDRGSGLTPEEQKRVWERFYRAKNVFVLSGHSIGLGLGLHICKTIIEEHGGSVGLYSVPGQGSRFWFTLPLATLFRSATLGQ
ncbi:MAG TPA: ATP-binding protein [Ktedonobacteraceae bacterium]